MRREYSDAPAVEKAIVEAKLPAEGPAPKDSLMSTAGSAMTVTEDQLLDLIADESVIDRIKLTRASSLEDLGVTSLDVISVLFEVENRYGVVISEGDMPQYKQTLGELSDFLLARINEPKA